MVKMVQSGGVEALPVVNAIPMVCAAAPGIRTYADLTTVSTRLS